MFEMFGKGVALDDVVCPHSSSELTTSRYLLTNLPKYLNCNCLLLIAFTTGILLQVPSSGCRQTFRYLHTCMYVRIIPK